ncbi:MAG: RagB/SusD family nutrient uptake outer membrane protein [Cytophagales bacterium]|nr:RagB/SusD family nutrient uptake outer membrane protein [Cytophagales bacterium]
MKKLFIISTLTVLFTACSLDTEDLASLSPGQALDNTAGVQSAVLSAYRRLHEFDLYGQQAMLHGDALADNIEIVNRTGRYEQEVVNGVGTFANRWAVAYRAINDANFVLKYLPLLNINQVPTSTLLTAQQVLNQLEGEAKFVRALAYSELLRVYAYEPGKEVNGFNLGVILRDTPTETVTNADNRARSTNLECYQFVEQDLLSAINLLITPTQQTTASLWPSALGAITSPFRANKAAAHALLARVYLYWGRYADADTQATTALSLLPTATPVAAGSYAASWSATTHPESIFEIEIRATDWSGVDGANNSLSSITTNLASGFQYVAAGSVELLAAHETGDVRATVFVNTAATLNKPQVRKWPGEKGGGVENIPVLRRSEMILIQAESRARQNNDSGAQTAISILRGARGLAATSLTGSQLINLIMNERRVELAFEGHRWFDLKRNGLDITKTTASGVNTLPYTDFRILQQIPNDQVLLNPSLQQNPGY